MKQIVSFTGRTVNRRRHFGADAIEAAIKHKKMTMDCL